MANRGRSLHPLRPLRPGRRSQSDLASLFRSGDVGILFEPQRLDTLWQDAAGVTPISTYGQGAQRLGDRSGGGHHATQASAASALIYGRHPVGGTRNQLIQTESFTGWQQAFLSATTGVTDAEGGKRAATLLRTADGDGAISVAAGLASASPIVVSVDAKAGASDWIVVQATLLPSPAGAYAVFNAATGAAGITGVYGTNAPTLSAPIPPVSLGNGWWRFFLKFTPHAASVGLTFSSWFKPVSANVSNQTTNVGQSITIARPQVEVGASATTYQRVGNAHDVTEAGKSDCYYGLCDGADNSLATAAFAWGSDKVYLCAAVRKNSDAAVGIIAEFSPTVATNNGMFQLAAPISLANNYSFTSKGTVAASASYTNAAVAAPHFAVIECIADIATDTSQLWIDGVMVAASGVDQGAGPFGTYQLFIGRRNNATLPFNGLLYGLMGLNRLPSDAERATARRLMAAKQGRTL